MHAVCCELFRHNRGHLWHFFYVLRLLMLAEKKGRDIFVTKNARIVASNCWNLVWRFHYEQQPLQAAAGQRTGCLINLHDDWQLLNTQQQQNGCMNFWLSKFASHAAWWQG